MVIFFIFIIIGFFLLCKGADILIDGAIAIGRRLRISEMIIGLTVISFGTSLPELIISLNSSIQGISDISIGNIIGSCICNLLLVLGFTSLVRKLPMERSSIRISLPISFLSCILLLFFGNIGSDISRIEGVMLLLFSLIFAINLWEISKKNKIEKTKLKQENIIKSIFKIIIGIVALKFGGDFVVDNSIKIAKIFNLSETFIGLTIIAIGTSLPELITGIIAAKKGETDLALGNIIGSNIFNILLVLGLVSIINPIPFSYEFNFSLIFLLLINFLVWWFNFWNEKNTITKYEGGILVLLYVGYISNLIIK